MIVDVPEIAGLADSSRRTPRCTEGFIAFLSFVTMLVCAIVPIAVVISVTGWSYECNNPAEVCREEESLRSQADHDMLLGWVLPCVVA